jgi:malate dehydrogenase (oxaloacetate-decarboxylating)
MDEAAVFPVEAADVAMQAIKDGVARVEMTWQEAFDKAKKDIDYARGLTDHLMEEKYIDAVPQELLDDALQAAIDEVK